MSSDLYYDLEYIHSVAGGDHEFILELVDGFIMSVEVRIESVRKSIDSLDEENIGFEGHALKGACHAFQAQRLVDIAYSLEIAGKQRDFLEVGRLYNHFCQHWKIAKGQLLDLKQNLQKPK